MWIYCRALQCESRQLCNLFGGTQLFSLLQSLLVNTALTKASQSFTYVSCRAKLCFFARLNADSLTRSRRSDSKNKMSGPPVLRLPPSLFFFFFLSKVRHTSPTWQLQINLQLLSVKFTVLLLTKAEEHIFTLHEKHRKAIKLLRRHSQFLITVM